MCAMEKLNDEIHLDITIDENEIIYGATKVVTSIRPNWPASELQFKIFTNGITNKLVGVWYPGHYNEMVLVRVYGHKTDLLINRKDETRNIRILYKAGHTHSLYATFNNGLAYQFVQGDILTVENVRQPEVYCLVAKRMAQMHRLNPDFSDTNKEPIIWDKCEKFMNIMPKEFADPEKQTRFEQLIRPYNVLKREYCDLKDELTKLNNPVVYAHNDLLLGNVLYNQDDNSVTFIDFEYTGLNYQAFDIANHFAEFVDHFEYPEIIKKCLRKQSFFYEEVKLTECIAKAEIFRFSIEMPDYSRYPEESLQRSWIKLYLESYNESSNVSEKDVTILYEHVKRFDLLCHFFWGCWSLIQSKHSFLDFDFLLYASIRFDEYFKRKESISGKLIDI